MALFRIFAYGIVATIYPIYSVVNKLKTPALVWLVCGILEVITIILLFKYAHFGIFTIPIVSMSTALLRNFIFTPLYAALCLDVKKSFFYINLLKNVVCALILTAVLYAIKSYISPYINSWFSFVPFCIVTGAILAFLTSIFIFNQQQKKSMVRIFKNKINGIK